MIEMIFRDADWVWEALIKQFEAETGLEVASVGDKVGHILGPNFEDANFQMNRMGIVFKGVEFEIEIEEKTQ